jgi:Ser/Thr protein kinase RdoA (MazF antagonist)
VVQDMAVEKTALNNNIISLLLSKEYNITTSNVEKLKIGSANCYKIFSFNKIFFLKEFQERFNASDIDEEACLLDFLISNHYPTTNIIKTNNHKNYTIVENRIVYLQKYIEGTTFCNNTAPNEILFASAMLLGKLHTILKGYKQLKCEMNTMWHKQFNPSKSAESFQLLIDIVDKNASDLNTQIYNDLVFKKNLQYKIAEYGEFIDSVSIGNTHGDYNCLQYICSDKQISAVIDFSTACYMPLCWEIMRSYVQSAPECKDGDYINIQQFKQYIKHYLNQCSLTKNDLRYMPYIYFYQLGRSKYGYKEYLSDAENKEELLNFAFWRTKMCRYLELNVDKISEALSKIL